MELSKYLRLSAKSLSSHFISQQCSGNESGDTSVGLKYDKTSDSFFAMVCIRKDLDCVHEYVFSKVEWFWQ